MMIFFHQLQEHLQIILNGGEIKSIVYAIVIDSIYGGRAFIRDPWPLGVGSSYSVPMSELKSLLTGDAVIIKP